MGISLCHCAAFLSVLASACGARHTTRGRDGSQRRPLLVGSQLIVHLAPATFASFATCRLCTREAILIDVDVHDMRNDGCYCPLDYDAADHGAGEPHHPTAAPRSFADVEEHQRAPTAQPAAQLRRVRALSQQYRWAKASSGQGSPCSPSISTRCSRTFTKARRAPCIVIRRGVIDVYGTCKLEHGRDP